MAAAAENGLVPEIIQLSAQCCHSHPNLQQVQIHVGAVERIPYQAFRQCPRLEQVEFVAITGRSSVAASAGENSPVQSRFVFIENDAFKGCPNLHTVIGLEHISCSLVRIGGCAFADCKKLTKFKFSCLTRLGHLGNYSFKGCASLTDVDLSNSLRLEAIRVWAFFNCKALRTIHLPSNLKHIDLQAFQDCNALVSVVIPTSMQTMDGQAFHSCSSLTQVIFQSMRHLGTLMNDLQFSCCHSLHTLDLQGPLITSKLWPPLLEQLLRPNGILFQAGIRNGKQRITIAWNFMRSNIANFCVEEKTPASRKRRILSSGDNV